MLIFAGRVNRRQQEAIAYLQEENGALREQRGGERLLSTDGPPRSSADAPLLPVQLGVPTLPFATPLC